MERLSVKTCGADQLAPSKRATAISSPPAMSSKVAASASTVRSFAHAATAVWSAKTAILGSKSAVPSSAIATGSLHTVPFQTLWIATVRFARDRAGSS